EIGDDTEGVGAEDESGDGVGGEDEVPAAGHDAVHAVTSRGFPTGSGGGSTSFSRWSNAARAPIVISAATISSMPAKFVISGMRNSRAIVFTLDCCWCSEFHHFTEK